MDALPLPIDRRNPERAVPDEGRRSFALAKVGAEVFYETNDRSAVVECLDLGLRGLSVYTRTPDAEGTRVIVRLALPDQTRLVRAEAEVVRVEGRVSALSFRHLSERDRQLLAAHLVRNIGLAALPSLGRRFGRDVWDA